jgi:hypothetical protein
MGRWFGYRPGYLDLCRLYTTPELSEWFAHIANAAEELREEFGIMAAIGATPREYGLKVQSHSVLMVTSRLKMRSARNLMLSFSGQVVETVALFQTPGVLARNIETARRLIGNLGEPERNPERIRDRRTQRWVGSYLWSGVEAALVVEFLSNYKTHPDAYKVNSLLLAEFIQAMERTRELTHWVVALMGGGKGAETPFREDVNLHMMKRKMKAAHGDRYSIGRLLSPRDEAIDLGESAWRAALKLTQDAWVKDAGRAAEDIEPDVPSGPAIRRIRGFGAPGVQAHPERGLLCLYTLDPQEAEVPGFTRETPEVAAFAISFPGSDSGTKVEYKVNNVLWEQEYGSAE